MSDPACSLVEIGDADFDARVRRSPGVVLVDFGAAWCQPCVALDRTLKALAQELAGEVTIFKMDVDASPETATHYGVRGMPTVLLFVAGQPVDSLIGLRPKRAYLDAISKHRARP
jgi:thioredoxin 1